FQLTRSAYERDRHRVAAALDRHRVAAAFLAISVRRLPERLFARAAPPLRPSSTAALLFPSIVGCSSRGGASFAPWAVFSITLPWRLLLSAAFGMLTAKHNTARIIMPPKRPDNDEERLARVDAVLEQLHRGQEEAL